VQHRKKVLGVTLVADTELPKILEPGKESVWIGTTITCSGLLFDPLATHLDILGESATLT